MNTHEFLVGAGNMYLIIWLVSFLLGMTVWASETEIPHLRDENKVKWAQLWMTLPIVAIPLFIWKMVKMAWTLK